MPFLSVVSSGSLIFLELTDLVGSLVLLAMALTAFENRYEYTSSRITLLMNDSMFFHGLSAFFSLLSFATDTFFSTKLNLGL